MEEQAPFDPAIFDTPGPSRDEARPLPPRRGRDLLEQLWYMMLDQRKSHQQMVRTVGTLSTLVEGPEGQPEEGLRVRVILLEKSARKNRNTNRKIMGIFLASVGSFVLLMLKTLWAKLTTTGK